MSDPADAQHSIRALAEDLTHRWLQTDEIPDDAIEATAPALRNLLGVAMELSFDDFQHRDRMRPDWGFVQFSTPLFPAPFEFYFPAGWRIEPTSEEGVATVIDREGGRRQVIQVANRSRYEDVIDGALYSGDLLGFEVGRDHGQFIHWRFVAAEANGFEVWSIFSAGDAAVVSLGDATDLESLKVQLTSSVNSIPWYHWIESAKSLPPQGG